MNYSGNTLPRVEGRSLKRLKSMSENEVDIDSVMEEKMKFNTSRPCVCNKKGENKL